MNETIKVIDSQEEVKNLKGTIVWLQTGTAWLKGLFFQDEFSSDIQSLLDDAFEELGNEFPTQLFEWFEVNDDSSEPYKLDFEEYTPLNGGEKYILNPAEIDTLN